MKKTRLHVMIDNDELAVLRNRADRHGIPVAFQIRLAIAAFNSGRYRKPRAGVLAPVRRKYPNSKGPKHENKRRSKV